MNTPAPCRLRPFALWRRVFRTFCIMALTPTIFLFACQSRLIYFPRAYGAAEPAAFQSRGGQRLDFTTGEGGQTAWLILPQEGGSAERLWIVCGGNAARALDMEDFCRALPFRSDAYLLVDYPGYGVCDGSPTPARIRESLRAVVPLAAQHVKVAEADIPSRVCIFGHSLGCAAGLIAAQEFGLRSAVLCSPFTSTMEMARVVLKLPLGFLVRHRFDNRTGLAALEKNHGHAWIFHGDNDRIIPAEMSRTLAREFPGTVTFTEIPGAGHNDILTRALPHLTPSLPNLVSAMSDARRRE